MSAEALPELLRPAEVARMCRVSLASVYRWLTAKKLPARKTPGGHFRIAREDAEACLAEPAARAPPRHRAGAKASAARERRTRSVLARHGLAPAEGEGE